MSYKIQMYAADGTKKEAMQLADIFADDQVNQALIHEYIVMYLANQRQGNARAKTRAEVRHSGRKLFRQKGTGRARVGDAGSPIRKKGWVAFGPTGMVHRSKKMNQKMRQKALLWAFVLQLQQGLISGVTELAFKAAKTQQAAGVLNALTLNTTKTLVVLDTHDEHIYKSFRNIPAVSITTLQMVNPYELLTHKHVLLTKQAIANLPTRFHLLTPSA